MAFLTLRVGNVEQRLRSVLTICSGDLTIWIDDLNDVFTVPASLPMLGACDLSRQPAMKAMECGARARDTARLPL